MFCAIFCLAAKRLRLLTVRECGVRPCPLALTPHACHYALKPSETRIVCEPMLPPVYFFLLLSLKFSIKVSMKNNCQQLFNHLLIYKN